MNYLAHLYLSGKSEGKIIGNFIADSLRSSQLKNYSDEIIDGILLHRKIDSFTDMHPIVKKSKLRLNPKYGKYSPVIVDIFYDYFLALDWENYSEITLRSFCDTTYDLLGKNYELFPLKSKMFFKYMTASDILFNYSTIDGIKKVLDGMSHRTRFDSHMHHAHHDLKNDCDLYKNEFEIFFSELKDLVL